MRIATYSRTFQILKDHGLYTKKSFGQNFIIDFNIIDKIVACAQIDKTIGVIEIGPGIGALTEGLVMKAGKVVAFEIDKKLITILEDNLKDYDNLKVINEDFLKVDLNKVLETEFKEYDKVCIVSNLPYYITTPILIKIFESNSKIYSITAMMQKEVAKRICAQKGGKEYNNLSILANYYSDCKIVLNVSKNIFVPRPNVDSAVVNFILNKKDEGLENEELFLTILRKSFSMRRKKLVNNLEEYGKDKILEILKSLNIDENVRAEELDIGEFIKISNLINQIKN